MMEVSIVNSPRSQLLVFLEEQFFTTNIYYTYVLGPPQSKLGLNLARNAGFDEITYTIFSAFNKTLVISLF
jgi:hypothetical protein